MNAPNPIIAQTKRLYLRRMREDDALFAFELNADPLVLKYTGDVAFESVAEAAMFLRNYTHYALYDFGRWAVIRKVDEAWLGWCGLKYHPEEDEVDVGYRLMQRYWGQGYATEAAKCALTLGFEKYQLPFVVGNVEAENKASCRVLEKLGLREMPQHATGTQLKYRVTASAFNTLKSQGY